jgi:hypothetical protein
MAKMGQWKRRVSRGSGVGLFRSCYDDALVSKSWGASLLLSSGGMDRRSVDLDVHLRCHHRSDIHLPETRLAGLVLGLMCDRRRWGVWAGVLFLGRKTMIAFAILNAFFWRMTGAGAGPWRKIGWPVLVVAFGFIHSAAWWQILTSLGLAVFAVTRPFTYFGDKISDSWFNWIWIWILGILFCGPMLIFGRLAFWPFAWCLAATLSNIPKTSKIFTWEFCECLLGICVML